MCCRNQQSQSETAISLVAGLPSSLCIVYAGKAGANVTLLQPLQQWLGNCRSNCSALLALCPRYWPSLPASTFHPFDTIVALYPGDSITRGHGHCRLAQGPNGALSSLLLPALAAACCFISPRNATLNFTTRLCRLRYVKDPPWPLSRLSNCLHD